MRTQKWQKELAPDRKITYSIDNDRNIGRKKPVKTNFYNMWSK